MRSPLFLGFAWFSKQKMIQMLMDDTPEESEFTVSSSPDDDSPDHSDPPKNKVAARVNDDFTVSRKEQQNGRQAVRARKNRWTDDGIEHVKWSDPIEDVLIVDPMAEMFIIGSEIDYVNELGGSYLKIVNPMQTSSCGCGSSFGV